MNLYWTGNIFSWKEWIVLTKIGSSPFIFEICGQYIRFRGMGLSSAVFKIKKTMIENFLWTEFWCTLLKNLIGNIINKNMTIIKLVVNRTGYNNGLDGFCCLGNMHDSGGQPKACTHYYLSHIMRKPVYAKCEQCRHRSACTSVQSDQCLIVRCLDNIIPIFKTLTSLCSWAGWFESYLVANLRRQVFSWHGLFFYRYTPGFLYMAIHELDEAHLGRFSFRSRDGVLEVGKMSWL